jgi:hypothetical protein
MVNIIIKEGIMDEYNKILNLANIKRYEEENDYYKIVVSGNKILGADEIAGVEAKLDEIKDGVIIKIVVREKVKVDKSVHICFGVLFSSIKQSVDIEIVGEKDSVINVFGHCLFSMADNVEHRMTGKIHLYENAQMSYFEKHVHNPSGGVSVYPQTEIILEKGAQYRADFDLLEGRVGELEIDYSTLCKEESRVEMVAKVNGYGNDKIKIRETAELEGRGSRAVLKTRIAARENTDAEVYNKIVAKGAYSVGHIDCSEIIRDNAVVKAYPDTEAMHPKARVTHEASLGGVDNKQLETLMAKGISEKEAEDLIIQGLLR